MNPSIQSNVFSSIFRVYGRDAGYSVNGSRRTVLSYDAATGRMAALNEGGAFQWEYLLGSDLKQKLIYPNGLTAEWGYNRCLWRFFVTRLLRAS